MPPSKLTQGELRRKFRNRAAEPVREAFNAFLRVTTVRFWFVNSNDDPSNKHSVKFCRLVGCGNCIRSDNPWLKFYIRSPARRSWDDHKNDLAERFQEDFSSNPRDEWTIKIRNVDAVRFLQKLSRTTDYPLLANGTRV